MSQVKVQLGEAMGTSLITLYGKALDARMSPSVLGDEMAAQAIDKIDYDFTKLGMTPKLAPNAAVRTKHFDNWTREFLATHDEATVVHLGAGLDPRVWRVDPAADVDWYDVDYPDVLDVRAKIFPERQHYRMIGCSVTDPDWLAQVPADRPTLIVAEGLTMYLRPQQGHELFRRIVERFPHGTITFDTHNRLAVRLVNKNLTRLFGAPLLHWAIEDPRELEAVDARLRCTDVVSTLLSPSAAALPKATRIFAKLMRHIRALRDMSLCVRYEFGTADRA
ncbi:class I SAM-dependent methyltransferase [Saccharopolyspora sp. K220]|uniref:class I SAM-dependent methyltransferase n=1 Tax=Saccharopolyspora soli TaxID=2926618 RepID=UPI001F578269|nr:class I SAM-dependent methyltransferase [Saccharopolyspora soli]MCI2417185.1 class I SAM-dependent methyltransferase [Saccharopolyspora soli]